MMESLLPVPPGFRSPPDLPSFLCSNHGYHATTANLNDERIRKNENSLIEKASSRPGKFYTLSNKNDMT